MTKEAQQEILAQLEGEVLSVDPAVISTTAITTTRSDVSSSTSSSSRSNVRCDIGGGSNNGIIIDKYSRIVQEFYFS
jgi:hypothetical protein